MDCKLCRRAVVVRGSWNLTILVSRPGRSPYLAQSDPFGYQPVKLIRRYSTSDFPQSYPCTLDEDESLTVSGAVSMSPQLV